MTAAYDALAAMAERELELVGSGELDRLPSLHAERAALVAALPAAPPAAVRGTLERTLRLQEEVTAALELRLCQAGAQLGRVTRGRTAMRGYAPAGERAKLVDRAG